MDKKLEQLIAESHSLREVILKMGWTDSGNRRRFMAKFISQNNISTLHFNRNVKKKQYERIIKECPVCSNKFVTKLHPTREGTTCSKSCAATWFRTGKNNPNWKGKSYRAECFLKRGKKCAVCDETLILDVHHIDGNRSNNDISNLIPLCPTHHRYMHSRYKSLIENKLEEYIKNMVIEA